MTALPRCVCDAFHHPCLVLQAVAFLAQRCPPQPQLQRRSLSELLAQCMTDADADLAQCIADAGLAAARDGVGAAGGAWGVARALNRAVHEARALADAGAGAPGSAQAWWPAPEFDKMNPQQARRSHGHGLVEGKIGGGLGTRVQTLMAREWGPVQRRGSAPSVFGLKWTVRTCLPLTVHTCHLGRGGLQLSRMLGWGSPHTRATLQSYEH